MAQSLGQELGQALANITALIMVCKPDERPQLLGQQAQIAGQLQRFVDGVVDQTLPEYVAATKALGEANAQAVQAKQKLDKIAATIQKVAAAVDKLAALAAKVA